MFIISCDVFSIRSTGEAIGTQEMPLIDTGTWNIMAFADEKGNMHMAVRKLDESNTLFEVDVDMKNRAPEEIAKDAALQIGALFDRLIKEQKEKDDQDTI